MNFDDYQANSNMTDQRPGVDGDALIIPLLGLAGETGTLLSEYKKQLRDGSAHTRFNQQVAEDLGDILWYVANVASKCGLSLEAVAQQNLTKTHARWLLGNVSPLLFDEGFLPEEQLPRVFEYVVGYREERGANKVVLLDPLDLNGTPVGNALTDNSYVDDGYRFHDVLHLAHAAVLGWSPVFRTLLKRKRKSSAKIDEVEDGGRAAAIEEAIAAASYEYAVRHHFLEGVERVDWELLRSIKRLTENLEVRNRTEADWEQAILAGFRVWRAVRKHDGGTVRGNLMSHTLDFVAPPATTALKSHP